MEAVARSVVNALYRHKLRGVYALCVRSRRLVISKHLRGIGGVEPAVNINSLGLCRAGGAGLRRGSWTDGSRLARCALSSGFVDSVTVPESTVTDGSSVEESESLSSFLHAEKEKSNIAASTAAANLKSFLSILLPPVVFIPGFIF